MMTEQFIESLQDQIEEHLNSNSFEVIRDAQLLGLDPRSGYCFWIGDQHIVVKKTNNNSLSYYGGFEYVDRECISEMGGYVFYSAFDSRVAEALDLYHDRPPADIAV